MRNFGLVLGLLLVLLTQTGCITDARWSEAGATAGLAPDLIAVPGTDGPRYQALYHLPPNDTFFGHALLYDLSPADLDALTVTLPSGPAPRVDENRLDQIDGYRLSPKAFVGTRSKESAEALKKRAVLPEVLVQGDRHDWTWCDVHAIASTMPSPGTAPTTQARDGRLIPLGPGARLIYLPRTQPRPPGERAGDETLAAFETPFLVVADVVFSPLTIIYAVTHR